MSRSIYLLRIGFGYDIVANFLPAGIGSPYSVVVTATGPGGVKSLALVADNNPDFSASALTDNGDSTATFAYTPTTGGTFALTIRATPTARDMPPFEKTFQLTVIPLPLELTGTLDGGTEGAAYSDAVSIIGGIAPYTLISSTGLPSGLSGAIAGSTVAVTGTPADGVAGNSPFAVSFTVEDSVGGQAVWNGSLAVTFVPITINGTDLPDAEVGTPYLQDRTISGGNGTYSIVSQTGLPSGVSASIVSGNQLRISGTPASGSDSGSPYSVNVVVRDSIVITPLRTGTFAENLVVDPLALFPPTSFSGLTCWLDASGTAQLYQDTAGTTPVTANGQNVRRIVDKATGKPHWVNAGGDSTFVSAAVNGKSAVNMVNSRRYNPSSSGNPSNYIANNAMTMMLVFEASGTFDNNANVFQNTFVFGDVRSGYFGIYLKNAPTVHCYNFDTNADSASATFAKSTYCVVQMRHRSGNIEIRINNGSWQTVASGNTGSLTFSPMQLGPLSGGTGGPMNWVHAVVYNVALSDPDADALRDWAKNEIGIP